MVEMTMVTLSWGEQRSEAEASAEGFEGRASRGGMEYVCEKS
jgi:hypothetical protein